jgi:hypothetical protein
MIRLKNILKENMRRFGTKNLNEQPDPIEYLEQIIDFDPNDLGDVNQQQQYGNELQKLDNLVDSSNTIPDKVVEKILDLGDYYIGSGGIIDADGFHQYLKAYKKLVSRYMNENLTEVEGLDPDVDSKQMSDILSRLESMYMQIKPKRVDTSEFVKDVQDLVSIYKDKTGADRTQSYYAAFFDLYPISRTNPSWKGKANDITTALNRLANLAKDINNGDTSNYLYRNM